VSKTDFLDEETVDTVELVDDEEGSLRGEFGRDMIKACDDCIELSGLGIEICNNFTEVMSPWSEVLSLSTSFLEVSGRTEFCC
jgi:hypothetical protein